MPKILMVDAAIRLREALSRHKRLTVAVSGGVDSLTLAVLAGRQIPDFSIAHAISPAVPAEATERVKSIAKREGWPVHLLNAREFDDPQYLRNPLNRCYFCKSNLYARIRTVTDATIAAGTNTDDLGEYRPGLNAAAENGIVHPYLEAKISKSELRQLAADNDLSEIATLPAQPCLASRVETGIAISATDMDFIHRAEKLAATLTDSADVRCRITSAGVRLETSLPAAPELKMAMADFCNTAGRLFAGAAVYKRGSAFVANDKS